MTELGNNLPWLMPLALAATGLISGFVNTLAGGGTLLTLPMLMLAGLPAERANATNRVCILGQSIAGGLDFKKAGQLETGLLLQTVIVASLGAGLGAAAASVIPPKAFHWLMLALLALMAYLLLTDRNFLKPKANITAPRAGAWLGLFATGFYGGFLQAGVGFLLLWVLVDGLGFQLNAGNAVKVVITGVYTVVALGVFVWYDLVDWLPGIYLTAGTIVGAKLAVRYSLKVDPQVIRRIVLVMVLVSLAAAALK